MSITSINIAKRALNWYGYIVPAGAAYGTGKFVDEKGKYKLYDYVYLGKKRPSYNEYFRKYTTEIFVYLHQHNNDSLPDKSDGLQFHSKWVDCSGDPFLLQLLERRINIKIQNGGVFIDQKIYDEYLNNKVSKKSERTQTNHTQNDKSQMHHNQDKGKPVDKKALLNRFSSLICYEKESNLAETNTFLYSSMQLNHLSVFKVIKEDDTLYPYRIKRLADVNEKGHITLFDENNTEESNYNTYNKFRYKQGPTVENEYGLWFWDIAKNFKDSSRIYVDTQYCESKPILIVENKSIEKVVELINEKGKLNKKFPIMASVMIKENKYFGALIDINKLNYSDGVYRLRDDIDYLESYVFDEEKIIHIEGKPFLRILNPGTSVGRYFLRPTEDIVVRIVREKINWNIFKDQGISRTVWKSIKNVFSSINKSTSVEEVSKILLCSEEEASERILKCTQRIERLFDPDRIESTILVDIIKTNPKIKEFYYDYAELHWKDENEPIVSEMELKIKDLEQSILTKTKQLEDIEIQLSDKKELLKKYDDNISEKKSIYDDYEKKIMTNLFEARNNILQLFSGVGNTAMFIRDYVIHNEFEIKESLSYDDVSELCDIIAENLEYSGVDPDLSYELSLFVFSAYMIRVPLLIAGPNAEYIGEALSFSLFGKAAGTIDCIENQDSNAISAIVNSDDHIMIFKNALSGDWINRIIDFGDKTDKFLVLSSNFAEDLVIEPKGILNYVIPLVTELYIDRKKKEDFVLGEPTELFEYPIIEETSKYKNRILDDMGLNSISKQNYISVLSLMIKLLEKETDFDLSIYAATSLITNSKNIIMDHLQSKSIDKKLKMKIEKFMGED